MSQSERGSWIPEALNNNGYKSVLDVFEQSCSKFKDQPAYSSFGKSISFAELDKLADAFAYYLQNSTSLQPGDRIAIQLPNILQYPVTLLGALRAGLIVVNTNPLYTPRELKHQFIDAQVKALVVYEGVANNVQQVLEHTEIEYVLTTNLADLHGFVSRHLINNVVKYVKKMIPEFSLPGAISLRTVIMQNYDKKPVAISKSASDIAVLQYTGGTTGVSKGVMLTHGNLVSNMLQAAEVISKAPGHWKDVVIAPLPLYHIYAFTISLIVMEAGGLSVLIANPRDIPGFVKELKKWKFTGFLGLNTLFVALCNKEAFKQLDFSHFCLTISGGMALTHDCAELWSKTTGLEIMEGYGLTETSPIVAVNPVKDIQVGTIGMPVAETQVRIIDSQEAVLPPGEAGELCVFGPQVMKGYWQNEQASSESFTVDGYLKTGDIATVDTNGRLTIVDRAKDLIIVSGFNVYPNEVEDIASSNPKVLECAAIGVKDDSCGEKVKLFVVASDPSLQVEELRDYCKIQLAKYKVPKEVEFVKELPKSNVGKVLRRMLRE
ncbi:MAG: AMP-binding protein [Pseudomonadales bacterium]|nr:AMP-binding protein [Pseudomonadales bacterium]NRA15347.1 AMP-binding protein [Oceanospirillaceae bacterium]